MAGVSGREPRALSARERWLWRLPMLAYALLLVVWVALFVHQCVRSANVIVPF